MEYSQLASDEWRTGKAVSLAATLNLSRLRMTAAVHYECSLLCIVVASALAEWSVAGFELNDLLAGKSLVDLYRSLDALAAQFRAVCNEVLHICYKTNIAGRFYGSGGEILAFNLHEANVGLLHIMRHARRLSTSLDSLLKPHTPALDVFKSMARICPCIVGVEDFLVLTLRAPVAPPADADASRSSAERLGLIEAPEIFDSVNAIFFPEELGAMMLEDYSRLARDLDGYRKILRTRLG